MSDALLEVRNLSVAYGQTQVTHGINLSLDAGATLAIVGESGSGKSTTATAALGLLPHSGRIVTGSIFFDHHDLVQLNSRQLQSMRGRSIGYIPQDPMSNLNPAWTVGFQIAETLRAHGIASGKEARHRAIDLLEEVGVPDPSRRARQYQHELSGGMRQRVLIAIAISCHPRLIVADEPTSALDVTVARKVLDLITEMQEKIGAALLLITHDVSLAAQRAHSIMVMRQGRVVESGASPTVMTQPGHSYTRALLAAAPAWDQPVAKRAISDTTAHSALLEAVELRKTYQLPGRFPWQKTTFTAVNKVSFTIHKAHTLAVVGESGSGKSTLGKMVLGLETPTSGLVKFDGTNLGEVHGAKRLAMRRRMQVVFQDPYGSLDPMHSVASAVEEALLTHGCKDKKERKQRVTDAVDAVRLPSWILHRFPNELSGGQRQRVAIARALVLQPELIVCDEAVSALDVLVQAQILALLQTLQEEQSLSYLFITHDLAVVRQIADDVLVMQQGCAVEKGRVAEIFHHPREEYTQRLLAAIPGRTLIP